MYRQWSCCTVSLSYVAADVWFGRSALCMMDNCCLQDQLLGKPLALNGISPARSCSPSPNLRLMLSAADNSYIQLP